MSTEPEVQEQTEAVDSKKSPCPICKQPITTNKYPRHVHVVACAKRNGVNVPVEEPSLAEVLAKQPEKSDAKPEAKPEATTKPDPQVEFAVNQQRRILEQLKARTAGPDGGLVPVVQENQHKRLEADLRALKLVDESESLYLGFPRQANSLGTQGWVPVKDARSGTQFGVDDLVAFKRLKVIGRVVEKDQAQQSRDRVASAWKEAEATLQTAVEKTA